MQNSNKMVAICRWIEILDGKSLKSITSSKWMKTLSRKITQIKPYYFREKAKSEQNPPSSCNKCKLKNIKQQKRYQYTYK